MNIRTTEELIAELVSNPQQPLSEEQKLQACDYAAGLFAGQLGGLSVETDLTMQQLQGMHTLSHKQTFFVEYFADQAGAADAETLGVDGHDQAEICRMLTDTKRMESTIAGEVRKEIAERSAL